MKAKPIWKGKIVFGLVQIPVALYDATKPPPLKLRLLRKKDSCPVGYARVCQETGEEILAEEIVRGFEYEKGKFVILTKSDLQKASEVRPKIIEIVQFVDEDQVASRFFQKPYFLEPGSEAKKPYALLREALKRSRKAAIARFVLRTREHLGILKGEEKVIYLHQLRYDWELRSPKNLNLPGTEEMKVEELDMAVKLIEYLSTPFRPEVYESTYLKKLSQVVEEKAREQLPPAKKQLPAGEKDEFLKKLQASLEMSKEEKSL